jgi:methionine-rich copper-binding protein CopC
VAFGLFVIAATPANAHDVLLESSPADGATLTETTDTIVLSFNNDIAEIGGKIKVSSDEVSESEYDLSAHGKDAVLELDAPLANGDYTVAWRVVSSDSHPIEGGLTFTIDDPNNVPQESPTPEESASEEPEPAETSTNAAPQSSEEPTDASSNAPVSPTPDATTEQPGINWGRIAVFGGLGALAGALLTYFTRKRSNSGDGSEN